MSTLTTEKMSLANWRNDSTTLGKINSLFIRLFFGVLFCIEKLHIKKICCEMKLKDTWEKVQH